MVKVTVQAYTCAKFDSITLYLTENTDFRCLHQPVHSVRGNSRCVVSIRQSARCTVWAVFTVTVVVVDMFTIGLFPLLPCKLRFVTHRLLISADCPFVCRHNCEGRLCRTLKSHSSGLLCLLVNTGARKWVYQNKVTCIYW